MSFSVLWYQIICNRYQFSSGYPPLTAHIGNTQGSPQADDFYLSRDSNSALSPIYWFSNWFFSRNKKRSQATFYFKLSALPTPGGLRTHTNVYFLYLAA